MRFPCGLVPAAAKRLFAGTAAAQVNGAIIAESAREFSRTHDVVPSPNGAFLYVADVDSNNIKRLQSVDADHPRRVRPARRTRHRHARRRRVPDACTD